MPTVNSLWGNETAVLLGGLKESDAKNALTETAKFMACRTS
jgi:geranylgeranyl pyrophosphate synthase